MALRDRRIRLLLGLAAAVAIGAALVAPVVLSGGSGGNPCAATLLFRGNTYTARDAAGFVQAVAIGVGVTRGCGIAAQNVDVRSLAGVASSRAIGVSGDQSSVYVRRGVCEGASSLFACLRR
ncbi:MAG: hypothetical protein ACRDL2_15865 [Gaiellaceae bacterium]